MCHKSERGAKRPLLLMILDGWGLAPAGPHNAVAAAKTPYLDQLFARHPHAKLACSGEAVGLPAGQMGNSEVGHTNIGAGRVVYQELSRITRDIQSGEFFENPVLLEAVSQAKIQKGAVHLMGLLSDGGVHSHMDHLLALLELCRRQGATAVVHCFLDGRDTPPESGADYLRKLEAALPDFPAQLGVVCGRYYAMDRDQRWDRVELAYQALLGHAEKAPLASAAVLQSYAAGITDEFVKPFRVGDCPVVTSRDSVIFYNFRPDRARALTRAFCDPDFIGFYRPDGALCPYYVCFTQYDAAMPNVSVAFPPQRLEDTLGQVLAQHGLTQLRIAETEKYAHVTFFFNGGEERVFPGEDRVLIPSPKVATYDLQPEMSAMPLARECIQRIESGKYDVIILNFANCDMVGHTGVMKAAVSAMETVDQCVGLVVCAVEAAGGAVLITADHGNAECMEQNGVPFTQHTTNPVPVLYTGAGKLQDGALCDLAPTLLALLGLPQPEAMTGHSLVEAEATQSNG